MDTVNAGHGGGDCRHLTTGRIVAVVRRLSLWCMDCVKHTSAYERNRATTYLHRVSSLLDNDKT
eukprot:6196205-Pleurochrysis_carterae.AAC.1